MEQTAYGGWPNCIKLSNGDIELIATTGVGPRIIRFGFVGKENEFHEDPEQMGKSGGNEWMAYGGHRFWLAPEAKPRSYYPDNFPIEFQQDGNTLRLISPVESTTGMQKEIEITLSPDENHVIVLHKVTNKTLWTVELAPWALSVMARGGKAIFPQEPYSPHPDIPDYPGQQIDPKYYLPVRNMVLWSYTKLSDPRWVFLENYMLLKQDRKADRPQKIGISNQVGWGAYARNGHLFVKKVSYEAGEIYPDNGCNFEAFTNSDMLELETLAPLVKLDSGASAVHREDWYLFDNVNFEDTDESIDASVMTRIKIIL